MTVLIMFIALSTTLCINAERLETCGNPYSYIKNAQYEECNRWGTTITVVLVYIIPSTLVCMSMAWTYICMKSISQNINVQTEAKWSGQAARNLIATRLEWCDSKVYYIYNHEEDNRHASDVEKGTNESEQNHLNHMDVYIVEGINDAKREDNLTAISLPYLFQRLINQHTVSSINLAWVLTNAITIITTLLIAQRSGYYWLTIGCMTTAIALIHAVVVTYCTTTITPTAIRHCFIRGGYEIATRGRIAKNTSKMKKPGHYIELVNATLTKGGNIGIRPIYYLDHVTDDDPRMYKLTSMERSLYGKSYSEAEKADKWFEKSQRALLGAAGSAAVATVIMLAGGFKSLDVNGTAPAIYALSSTLTIAAFAQSVDSLAKFYNGRASNTMATKGIVAINLDSWDEMEKWAKNRLNEIYDTWRGNLFVKTKNASVEEILDNTYFDLRKSLQLSNTIEAKISGKEAVEIEKFFR